MPLKLSKCLSNFDLRPQKLNIIALDILAMVCWRKM